MPFAKIATRYLSQGQAPVFIENTITHSANKFKTGSLTLKLLLYIKIICYSIEQETLL
ncbi:hypothetical protein CLV62_14010 [Dysgonomonas alginatilytica]|uniref:Uncharacterized protein n=1 Tax=Dysgonomonas alginatilytica TaxID=1605892 RepID=A0A2V3PQ65_9BACT|nr:hypothetical protein CLV62_14010 [Dysgonomonas alginatilytica]